MQVGGLKPGTYHARFGLDTAKSQGLEGDFATQKGFGQLDVLQVASPEPKLPKGQRFGAISRVATDSQDRIFVFQRIDPAVMVFDRDFTLRIANPSASGILRTDTAELLGQNCAAWQQLSRSRGSSPVRRSSSQ